MAWLNNNDLLSSSNMGLSTNSVATGVQSPSFMDSFNNWFDNSGFLAKKDANGITSGGWGTAGLGVAQGLGNLWLGMQQYGLAKDTLAANKEQFAMNYDAQKKTTNSALEDRQRARVASNAGAYQSVSDYMKKNGIA